MFPRTDVGGVSLSRMIIGTNWMLGYSHTGNAADRMIKDNVRTPEDISAMLEVFLNAGVDTIMAPFSGGQSGGAVQIVIDAIKATEDKTGKKIIMIDTPVLNVDDNAAARKEAEAVIKQSKELGVTFCMPHHTSVEQLVNKNKEIIDRLPDYLDMIRAQGLNTGLSAHMPEIIIYSDQNDYDVDTYIQLFNCMGFLMQVEIEYIQKVIWNAKKPVMTIKPMAAGRVTPLVGFTFSWNAIRDCDMVTAGCMTPWEAIEDIEFSLAAIEHRLPRLVGRSSPAKTKIIQG